MTLYFRKKLLQFFSLTIILFGCSVEARPVPNVNKSMIINSKQNSELELGQIAFMDKDYENAAKHWKIAMNQGEIAAYSNYAFLLYNGFGVKQDQGEAIKLWEFAANKGFIEAHRHLGAALMDGQFLKKNPKEAFARYLVAFELSRISSAPFAQKVMERALKGMKEAKNDLSDEQVQEAKNRAEEILDEISTEEDDSL